MTRSQEMYSLWIKAVKIVPILSLMISRSNLWCRLLVSMVMSRGWLKASFVPNAGRQSFIQMLPPGTCQVQRILENRLCRDCWNSQKWQNRLEATSHTTSSTYVHWQSSAQLLTPPPEQNVTIQTSSGDECTKAIFTPKKPRNVLKNEK